MQEEVNDKTVVLCVKTVKMSASILMKAMQKYLQHEKQRQLVKKQSVEAAKRARKNEPVPGRITVKDLAKQNAGMVDIEITSKNIREFERYARKYGVNYALKKDKSKDPPVYIVFFKARDKGAINAAFREFTERKLKKANRPSIHERLNIAKEKIAGRKTDRSKHKHQEQSL